MLSISLSDLAMELELVSLVTGRSESLDESVNAYMYNDMYNNYNHIL